MTTLGILEGSLRQKSLSRALAKAATNLLPDGMTAEILPNPGTLPLFNQDVLDDGAPASVQAMIEATQGIDALLIVTPEYNWSIPGGLKNALDWLSKAPVHPLAGKPVAIWTVSPGLLGGARVHEALRHVLHSQDMMIMAKPEVQVGGAIAKVDVAAGALKSPETEDFLRAHLGAFSTFCNSWTRG